MEGNVLAAVRNNVLATRALLAACDRIGVSKFLLVSSDKAVRPTSAPLTDDRAPVEWLTDRMILDQIERGGSTSEPALPTAHG